MFRSTADDVRSRWALPVFKLPPGASGSLVIQSGTIIYLDVHWLGRAVVCTGEGCLGCESVTARTKGYFVAICETPQKKWPVLVEATPQSIVRLEEQLLFNGVKHPRGQRVICTRRAKNRPLVFEPMDEVGFVDNVLTSGHRLVSAVALLFGLPLPHREESFEDYSDRIVPHCELLLASGIARSQ